MALLNRERFITALKNCVEDELYNCVEDELDGPDDEHRVYSVDVTPMPDAAAPDGIGGLAVRVAYSELKEDGPDTYHEATFHLTVGA